MAERDLLLELRDVLSDVALWLKQADARLAALEKGQRILLDNLPLLEALVADKELRAEVAERKRAFIAEVVAKLSRKTA